MTNSTSAEALAAIIERIAKQWDGCMYGAVGEDIDIGYAIRSAAKNAGASLQVQAAELSEQERTDLLDWVSTCQSSYAMTQTGHRFASQPNFLKENRAGLVEYVNQCLRSRAATSQAQAAEGSKPRQDAGQQLIAERGLFLKEFGDRKEAAELFDARWDAWLARAGIATNCKHPDAACSIGPTTDQRNWYCPACRVSWVTFPTDEERRAAVRGQS